MFVDLNRLLHMALARHDAQVTATALYTVLLSCTFCVQQLGPLEASQSCLWPLAAAEMRSSAAAQVSLIYRVSGSYAAAAPAASAPLRAAKFSLKARP